ncbi:hypothetical protein ABZ208_19170 [Streptomyces sp. NPDC006208]|uniref:hypothetical protein n=1 Tax=Streptomyces sp. NPDC006208 TaxID=3156734 RepID=UPI0033A336B3
MDESLSFESFFEGARKAAQKAMDDHAHGEYDEFALHAGVAIERLAKAALVSRNPIYILEMRGSVEMLFHLGGHRRAKKVRSVGASEAIDRCRKLDILGDDKNLDLLIDLRNGVAHSTTGDQAKGLLPTLVETVEAFQKDLGGPLNVFWGQYNSMARLAVDRKRSEVSREVQVRIRQARHTFSKRFEGLPEGSRDQFLSSQGQLLRYMMSADRARLLVSSCVSCPSCTGWADAILNLVEEERATMSLVPGGVVCSLCGLAIDGVDEIKAADLNQVDIAEGADHVMRSAYSHMTGGVLMRTISDGIIRLNQWVPLWRHEMTLPDGSVFGDLRF